MADQVPLVVQIMRDFRAQLMAMDVNQFAVMTRRWLVIERSLEGLMFMLSSDMSQIQADGGDVSLAKVMRLERYQRLLAQLQSELGEYNRWLEQVITDKQASYGAIGIQASTDAINAVYSAGGVVTADFATLPVDAIQNMVGLAGNGSPLFDLLQEAFPTTADAVTRMLIQSTALGTNPRETARLMARGMEAGLQRSMLIARTEQLRVYREAAMQNYKASGVVSGWMRISARDLRVCPACLFADDGSIHPLTEEFPEHPSGRCSPVPRVIDMPKIEWQTGQDWFGGLTEADQRGLIGNTRHNAWQAGKLNLNEIAMIKPNSTWGPSLQVAPLRGAK